MRLGLREANQHFSKAIRAVKAGQEVVLTERGLEKRWMTNEVPVKGTVRVELDGKLVSELVEWGSREKKPEGKSER